LRTRIAKQRQSRSDTASRTDRAEQIGVVVALDGRLSGPRSTPGLLADEAVLLANSSFILKPDRQAQASAAQSCARTLETVVDAIRELLDAYTAPQCADYFPNEGYGQA
jgi:hypothetical protein